MNKARLSEQMKIKYLLTVHHKSREEVKMFERTAFSELLELWIARSPSKTANQALSFKLYTFLISDFQLLLTEKL